MGLNFYIVIYRECLKKCFSQDLLYQMGQYLAWIIPRTKRFSVVQIKSLGSQMTTPYGDMVLYMFRVMYGCVPGAKAFM